MVDVIPLDICGVILGNPYLWDIDALYYRRLNKYKLVKDGKDYLVIPQKRKKKLPLVTTS